MGRKINKGLVFGIGLLMAAIVFAVAMTMNISANGPESPAGQGITLITECDIGRVIEVDSSGEIVWDNTDPDLVKYPFDLDYPVDAERLENGNTLITEAGNGRVIEVDSSGKEVWWMDGLESPMDVERFIPPIDANVDIYPNTLNLRSKGKWITARIELPEGYDVADIDVSTILLNGTELSPTSIGNYNSDEIHDLMVKFDRGEVIEVIINILGEGDDVEIIITGALLSDDTKFKGRDTIRVINEGKKEKK